MSVTGDITFVSRLREMNFSRPRAIVSASRIEEVVPALNQIQNAVNDGNWAAGFIAYEAAPAFDRAMVCHPPGDLPLLWFGIYHAKTKTERKRGPHSVSEWEPGITRDEYLARVQQIKELIAAGDTYQVNFAFPLHATFTGDAYGWFRGLCEAQQANYSAYVDAGAYKIVCVSPEQFFGLANGVLRTRPMKGTRPRGRYLEEDDAIAEALHRSDKDRAENVMIVDMLRNDMGRVSEFGSVRVEQLFVTERYPTVWQMTSRLVSKTRARTPQIIAALFPSGSVTGAPKIRTMQIIRDMEPFPRGAYCGTIGWMAPGGRSAFNVAIRCATIDTRSGVAEYPVGSGITWGSDAVQEYDECLSKAAVLRHRREPFELLETLLYDREVFLLEEHLARLARSARYFGFAVKPETVRAAVLEAARNTQGPKRVRLLVDASGATRVEVDDISGGNDLRVGFARQCVRSEDVFLFHKTTRREVYDLARASRPDCDDVLLWNEAGDVTESTIANVVVEKDGKKWTPPVSSGLLAGTFREVLLRQGAIAERRVTRDELRAADAVYLINSVRKWMRARLAE